MRYVHLGRLGVQVSRLGFGAARFGYAAGRQYGAAGPDEQECHRLLDHALERGVTLIDTADVYGWDLGAGLSECVIGRWLAQGGRRRERIVLATKVYHPVGEGPNDKGLSARHIKLACEASLRRLQTDYIDLYQMHHVDRATPWEEIWQAMEVLIREGKVIYVGSSNFAAWHIAEAHSTARALGLPGLASEQCKYNLLSRKVEMEILPACQAFGVGIITYEPLAGGALSGSLEPAQVGLRAVPLARERMERHRAAIEAYVELCSEIGESPSVVALAWLLNNPAVTVPIVGWRTLDQLDGTLRSLDLTLPHDVLDRLDAIFPGPGHPAPEAYYRE